MSEACFPEKIQEFLDQNLAPEEVQFLYRHFQECTNCRTEYELLKSAAALLQESREEVPADLHQLIMAALPAKEEKAAETQKIQKFVWSFPSLSRERFSPSRLWAGLGTTVMASLASLLIWLGVSDQIFRIFTTGLIDLVSMPLYLKHGLKDSQLYLSKMLQVLIVLTKSSAKILAALNFYNSILEQPLIIVSAAVLLIFSLFAIAAIFLPLKLVRANLALI